jgi:iron complex transport system ATP-binding protein
MNAVTGPVLSFEKLSFRYQADRPPVMEHFQLDIPPGSITAILGPNGAGKTTLLLLGLGWLYPQEGKVLREGKPIRAYSRREMGQWCALVPQSEHIPFEYSVLEFVLLGRSPYLNPLEMPGEHDCQVALQALNEMGLGAMAERSILSLSGGERQLALVARALAQEPHLLYLDEPTAHLDLANKERLVRVLRELNQRGITIILTTHEPEVAASLATHLVLVRQGTVLRAGGFHEMFTTENLSELYGLPVEVVEHKSKKLAVWA